MLTLFLSHACAIIAITLSPLFTFYLQSDYLRSSFAHKRAILKRQLGLVSDLVGRNVGKAPVQELGEICKNAFYRLSSSSSHLTLADFERVFASRERAVQAYSLFAPPPTATTSTTTKTTSHISDHKFAQTISEIVNEWRQQKHSITRTTIIFSVFCGLLDVLVCMLSALFVMAILGYSTIDMMAAALFMYGIVNGFFAEAVQQWKFGTYLIVCVHPYDIGDVVRVPGCGRTPVSVVDYSLTKTLFRKPEGQLVTMQHRHMAYQCITNLSRPRSHRVVLTLSADDVKGVPVASFIRQLLLGGGADFKPEFRISRRQQVGTKTAFGEEGRTRVQLTFQEGQSARQRMRALIRFCSSLKEAALEAQVHDDGDDI
jgi:small-conductance mechanosensitive channel